MAVAMDTDKYETTVRMEHDLADRLDVVSKVKRISKNQLLVAALRQFLYEIEEDPEFQQERTALIDRWSNKED